MVTDAPHFLDNDGDAPVWVREDLATNEADVVAYLRAECCWADDDAPEVSGPEPMARFIGPQRDSEEHWRVVPEHKAEARYWKVVW